MKKNEILLFIIAVTLSMLAYFILGNPDMNQSSLTLTSKSFTSGGIIPKKYTCDGENISPQLSWSGLKSENVKNYVLVVDDPDAKQVVGKTFVHWIVLLSPNTTMLPEGISGNKTSSLSSIDTAAKELTNDFSNNYYGGPCPPSGTHTYRFTLFALSQPLDALNGDFFTKAFTADAFRNYMTRNIIAETTITGTYIHKDSHER